MTARYLRPDDRAAAPSTEPAHHVGPNAIIQTCEAVTRLCGPTVCEEVCGRAGIADRHPERMVDAAVVRALNAAVAQSVPKATAAAIMRLAGRLTGDYILHNRIPAPARRLLRLAPAPLARRMLLRAIIGHSWTFAGEAPVRSSGKTIEIAGNPLALGPCLWHEAVFERLLRRLADDSIRVRETACCASGAETCRFLIGP